MTPPLVLLHGMLGGPSSFDALRSAMGARTCHALSLFGHGPRPEAVPQRFDEAADRLADRVDALVGTTPVDLIGYSLGARLGLALCARHPRRFRRAMLISGHPGLGTEEERCARREQDEAQAVRVEREGLAAFVDAWEQLPMFISQRTLPPQLIAVQRAIRLGHQPSGIAAAFRRLGLGEMPPLSSAITALGDRLRLVVGALDDRFVQLHAALARERPDLAIDLVPQCGHNPLLEAPAQLARLANHFFASAAAVSRPNPTMESFS